MEAFLHKLGFVVLTSDGLLDRHCQLIDVIRKVLYIDQYYLGYFIYTYGLAFSYTATVIYSFCRVLTLSQSQSLSLNLDPSAPAQARQLMTVNPTPTHRAPPACV